VAAETFEAVRVLAPADLFDFDRRLRAVVEFAALPEASALAAANKRIGNILRQAGSGERREVDPALLERGAETDLHAAVAAAAAAIAPLVADGAYVEILRRLAALREPVDRFFDAVMVMVDDAARRGNRLALLERLQRMFLHVADIALLPAAERAATTAAA
jgi:glycyl-tRNA synthetase beta chain